MKIKTKTLDYDAVLALPRPKHKSPVRPALPFRFLLKAVGHGDLKATQFTCEKVGMEKLGKDEPALFLMNHSSFIDLKIAAHILYPRPFNIVCTSDGFIGKAWLMRHLGCIPTHKFVTDINLVRDMQYTADTLHSSILMYPEASYSFDGTATPLPDTLSKCVKRLGIPVVMIRTQGAFSRDPLYNMLQLRKVKVSATMEYLFSPDEIKAMKPEEIQDRLNKEFTFDHFRWQQEHGIRITEPFRADGLNRVLYKCPDCRSEGRMQGKGTHLLCRHCGSDWELTEDGYLKKSVGENRFSHIPDWFRWQREEVRRSLEEGSYRLDIPVKIGMMIDRKFIYFIGDGRLVHDREGFHLTGADGRLDYRQKPTASYSLYSDYFWYEIGDMICIGNRSTLYYCFPQESGDVVARTRLAAEELYKIAHT